MSVRQIWNRQRHPSARKRFRAASPRSQPIGPERGGQLLVHRSRWHADQPHVRRRSARVRARGQPSADPAAIAASDRQVTPVPRHPTVHTRTDLPQKEVKTPPDHNTVRSSARNVIFNNIMKRSVATLPIRQ